MRVRMSRPAIKASSACRFIFVFSCKDLWLEEDLQVIYSSQAAAS